MMLLNNSYKHLLSFAVLARDNDNRATSCEAIVGLIIYILIFSILIIIALGFERVLRGGFNETLLRRKYGNHLLQPAA